ncbi:hypothetical protein [Aeromonas sp.]|uniref:hypothetical protein n=1 Tax=Aeromonas sp. TaxID=647 RepID=UPI002584BE77|nr:hypothetical protein [Aeromonas sp.]MCX7127980.1 hypothetical protein [Aeromonas sp.]
MIDLLSMLGSWVSGVGTVGAVLYAININKPKVKSFVSDVKHGEDGDFTIDIYNERAISAHISHIRLVPTWTMKYGKVKKTRFSHNSIIKGSDKRQHERLNIEIKPGMFEQFDFSASSLLKAYCEFCSISSADTMMRMTKARLAIYLTTGSVCYVDLPKSQYQKIKNSMFLPVKRRIESYTKIDFHLHFPSDYTEEHKGNIYKSELDAFELASRRHKYILLPFGISTDDSLNNR